MDDRLKQLSHHQSTIIGLDECKKSAVCIPLLRKEQGYDILFEVRSGKIKHQPGDICFPGGMVEPSETSLRRRYGKHRKNCFCPEIRLR